MARHTLLVVALAIVFALGGFAQALVITLDNDTGVSPDGTVVFSTSPGWVTSTSTAGYIGANYYHDSSQPNHTGTYTPNIPTAGIWQVEARWTGGGNRAVDAPYTINYDGGSVVIPENQRNNAGQWNSLGLFQFAAGTSGSVQIASALTPGANSYVIADGIRFTYLPSYEPGVPAILTAVEDAHVRGGTNAGTNYGSNAVLEVKSMSSDLANSRKAYLKFSAPAILFPFDIATQLTDATLTLHFVDPFLAAATLPPPDAVYQFGVYGIPSDGWAEGSINWNNAPYNVTGSSTAMLTGPAEAVLLGTFDILGTGIGTTVDFTSPELIDFIQANAVDDLLSFAIVRNTTQETIPGAPTWVHAIASSESLDSTLWPELSLMGFEIPEPASLALLGLGSLLLARRRRRS